MRILQVSDFHGSVRAAELARDKAGGVAADLIVVVGDITHVGGRGEAEEILGRLAQAGRPILFVIGNMDLPSILEWSPEGVRAENIHGRLVEHGGWRFYGLAGGVGRGIGTPTEFSDEEAGRLLQSIPQPMDKLILVTHTPPHGLEVDLAGSRHIGSKAVREFVERHQPPLVCCGHVHEARAISRLGRTVVVNAGPAKDGNCAVIDLGEGGVEARLDRLP